MEKNRIKQVMITPIPITNEKKREIGKALSKYFSKPAAEIMVTGIFRYRGSENS